MKQTFIIIFLLAITLLIGVLWWTKTQPVNNRESLEKSLTEDTVTTPSASVMTSDWKVYKNEEIGFSFSYPSSWAFEEMAVSAADFSDIHPDWIFRYIVLHAKDFDIEIGVKKIDEGDKIKLQSWRTGIPAGDFQKGEILSISDGKTQVWRLVYNDGSTNHTQMVWYCNPNTSGDICNEFPIDKKRVALIGISSLQEDDSDPWIQIIEQTKKVIESFQTF